MNGSLRFFIPRAFLLFEKTVMIIGCVALTLIICASVVARYFLRANLYGYEEIVTIFAFWVYFMGGAYGAYEGTHISADLVNVYLKDCVLKNTVTLIKDGVTFGISLLFTWYGYEFFMFGFMGPLGTGIALPTTPVWRIPMWVSYAAIFLGLTLMSAYFGRNLVRDIRIMFFGGAAPLVTGDPAPDVELTEEKS